VLYSLTLLRLYRQAAQRVKPRFQKIHTHSCQKRFLFCRSNSFALGCREGYFRFGLSGGVTVALGPLEASVLVRIQAGQPASLTASFLNNHGHFLHIPRPTLAAFPEGSSPIRFRRKLNFYWQFHWHSKGRMFPARCQCPEGVRR
jgi:hypothetical protein